MGTPNRRPTLEALEDRTLPTGASLLGPVATPLALPALVLPALAPSSVSNQLQLRGHIGGSFTVKNGKPDTGSVQTLTARGSVQPLGTVRLTGSLHIPGLIRHGQITGTVTLTGSQGSVIVTLAGPMTGSAAKVVGINYRLSGTGKYRGKTGSGVVVLTETQAGPHAALTFGLDF